MKLNTILAMLFSLLFVTCASIEDEVKQQADRNASYQSNDGTTINAYLSLPKDADGAPAVLMIHDHGGV